MAAFFDEMTKAVHLHGALEPKQPDQNFTATDESKQVAELAETQGLKSLTIDAGSQKKRPASETFAILDELRDRIEKSMALDIRAIPGLTHPGVALAARIQNCSFIETNSAAKTQLLICISCTFNNNFLSRLQEIAEMLTLAVTTEQQLRNALDTETKATDNLIKAHDAGQHIIKKQEIYVKYKELLEFLQSINHAYQALKPLKEYKALIDNALSEIGPQDNKSDNKSKDDQGVVQSQAETLATVQSAFVAPLQQSSSGSPASTSKSSHLSTTPTVGSAKPSAKRASAKPKAKPSAKQAPAPVIMSDVTQGSGNKNSALSSAARAFKPNAQSQGSRAKAL